MNTSEIKILLDKYFEGETTREEEKSLKNFFRQEEIPAELQPYRAMFGFFEKEKNIATDEDFEERVMGKISRTPVVPIYKTRRFWYYFSGVAASILFVLALIFESTSQRQDEMYAGSTYTRDEARVAYHDVQRTLAYVSGKYTRGVKPLTKMAKISYGAMTMGEIGKFNQGLEQLDNNVKSIRKVNDGVENLSKLSKFSIVIKP